MVSPPDSPAHLTIPNMITLGRILLTPLFIIFLIQGRYAGACGIFLVAVISDVVDGIIARRFGQKSPLGTFLDPLADKLLMGASFVTLGIAGRIPSWLTVIVLSRDLILVLGVTLCKLVNLPVLVHPSVAGKITTVSQALTVLLVLLHQTWDLPGVFLEGLFWFTGGVTTLSGLHYVFQALWHLTRTENQPG